MPLDLKMFQNADDTHHANDDVWTDALIELLPQLPVGTTHLSKSGKTVEVHFVNKFIFTIPDFTVVQPEDALKDMETELHAFI